MLRRVSVLPHLSMQPHRTPAGDGRAVAEADPRRPGNHAQAARAQDLQAPGPRRTGGIDHACRGAYSGLILSNCSKKLLFQRSTKPFEKKVPTTLKHSSRTALNMRKRYSKSIDESNTQRGAHSVCMIPAENYEPLPSQLAGALLLTRRKSGEGKPVQIQCPADVARVGSGDVVLCDDLPSTTPYSVHDCLVVFSRWTLWSRSWTLL